MSQFFDVGYKSFEADGTIGIYERVKLDSDGKVTQAGLADRCIGVACKAAVAGDNIAVALYAKCGTMKMVAVEALAAGAVVYGEASGKVQDTAAATAYPIGIALEAATADGDVIEVMPAVGNEANP